MGRPTSFRALFFALLSLFVIACGDDDEADGTTGPADSTDSTDSMVSPTTDTPPTGSALEPLDLDPNCDPIHEGHCIMPYPSSLFLEPDPDRGSGYTLAFGEESLPANGRNIRVSPEPFRRMDGYSLGTILALNFPDIDNANFPSESDLSQGLADESPIYFLQVTDDGVERVPFWAEMDAQGGPRSGQSMIVRPAVILEEGTRYVVGVRNLASRDGDVYEPTEAFTRLVNGTTEQDPLLASRQSRFDEIFDFLEGEGMERDELQVAWDFVTASTDGLHGNMLHMRDRALELFPDGVGFELESVERFTRPGEGPLDEEDNPIYPTNPYSALRIVASFQVPHFMVEQELGDSSGFVFNLDESGMPVERRDADGELELRTGRIWIQIPHTAFEDVEQGLVMYGHGLNGTGGQTIGNANGRIGERHDLIFFGISMIGMSGEDVDGILYMVTNFNAFPWLADRLHQGMIEHVLVARGAQNFLADFINDVIESETDLFTDDEAADELPIVETNDELYWSGISQGGIFGSTVLALSPDITLGHLGVPGNNYSTLLTRSIDFNPFFALMRSQYRDRVDQMLLISIIQTLWDAADPVSYLRRLSSMPFEGNDPNYVMLVPAKGDYQVEVFTNEIAARTENLEIALMENYDSDRAPQMIEQTPYPHTGSGVVLYDFGNPWPPYDFNRPPSDDLGDPHGLPRTLVEHNDQMVHFFRNGGEIIDVCGGEPCVFPR